MANKVIITVDAVNKTVEFKRMNGVNVLHLLLTSSCFEVDWNKSVNPNIFNILSSVAAESPFVIEHREVSDTYATAQDFYDYLQSICDCNNEGSGGGGAGGATESTQAEILTEIEGISNALSKKNVGKIMDLSQPTSGTWVAFPLDLEHSPTASVVITTEDPDFGTIEIQTGDISASDSKSLASILNDKQSYYVFSAIDTTILLVNDGTITLTELVSIEIKTVSAGNFFFELLQDSPDTTASNIDEINEKLKALRLQLGIAERTLNEISDLSTKVSTATKQDELKAEVQNLIQDVSDFLSKKNIGKVFDLAAPSVGSWGGFPLNFIDPPLASILITTLDTETLNIELEVGLTAVDAKDLVSILNDKQDYYVFSVADATTLLINDGTTSTNELVQIELKTTNFGDFLYDSFADSSDTSISNVDEINEKLKALSTQVGLLQQILYALSPETNDFTSANTTATSLPLAGNEYFIAAFRLKPGLDPVTVKKFQIEIVSLSNDDVKVRVGFNKTLSTNLVNSNFVDIDGSSFQVARNLSTRTATGFSAGGRNILTRHVSATEHVLDSVEGIYVPQGVVFYITGQPRTNGGSVDDIENWAEIIPKLF